MPILDTSRDARLARLGAMFDASPIGIAVLSPVGELLECNAAYERLTGYSAEELRGRSIAALSVPGGADENFRLLGEMVAGTRDLYTTEKSYRRKSGEEIFVRVTATAVRDADGNLLQSVGMVEDISERRQITQALRERESWQSEILASIPIILYRTEPSAPYAPQYVKAGSELLGYALDEWCGSENVWYTRLHPDDRDRVLHAFDEARASRRRVDLEYRMVARDGTEHWFRDRGEFVYDANGAPIACQGVLHDVTERRRTIEALRSSEALFRSITEQSAEVISVTEPDSRIRYISPAVERMLGWTPEELTGRTVADITHPDDLPRLAAAIEEATREPGARTQLRFRVRHKNGDWRIASSSGTNLLDHASIRGIVGNTSDVTEQVRAENDLRLQAQVLNAVQQAVIVIDRDGRVAYWNRFAESLFGCPSSEILGRRYMEFAFATVTEDDRERFRLLIAGGPPMSRERMLRRRDGSQFLAAITASAFFDADGQTIGVASMVTDISERRRLEEQLRRSQKMEAVGQLAGGVAHDFNNILTVISGRAEFLRDSEPGAEGWREDIDEVLQAAMRASRLTRQLLAFSRKQMMQPRLLDLRDVVEDLAPMLQRLINEDIELVMRYADDTLAVHADPGQLEQVLVNLVVNARDAMPHGGVIMISTRTQALAADSPVAREYQAPPGTYTVLSVSDTGSGIDPSNISRIFEPFFTTKEPGQGTGLGLSTVYGIVTQSGGFVTVRSAPDKGAQFDVYFPSVVDEVAAPVDSADEAGQVGGPETILLVEDSEPVRNLAERVLRQNGYRVLTASNGSEALELADELSGHIDLLLTDVVMPRMSGRELAETISARFPGVRTLYMSGYTDDIITRKGLDLPGVSFLEKPFTPKLLAQRVRALLDERPSRSEGQARPAAASRF